MNMNEIVVAYGSAITAGLGVIARYAVPLLKEKTKLAQFERWLKTGIQSCKAVEQAAEYVTGVDKAGKVQQVLRNEGVPEHLIEIFHEGSVQVAKGAKTVKEVLTSIQGVFDADSFDDAQEATAAADQTSSTAAVEVDAEAADETAEIKESDAQLAGEQGLLIKAAVKAVLTEAGLYNAGATSAAESAKTATAEKMQAAQSVAQSAPVAAAAPTAAGVTA